jgi:adenylate cyclase
VFLVPWNLIPGRTAAAPTTTTLNAALARETLASSRLCAAVLAVVLALILVAYTFFFLYFPDVDLVVWHGHIELGMILGLYLPAIVFELLVFGLLTYDLRKGNQPHTALVYVISLAETSFPTCALLVLTRAMHPMFALAQTPTHQYYLFILLSTLRLKPWLSIFTGVVAAAEYLTLVAVFASRGEMLVDEAGLNVLPLHVWKAILYFIAGAGAAFVASQIRKQVANALRSVEEQKHIRDVFGKHVSPQVVDQLLRQDVVSDGEVRHVCVMFLDIRDFTARSSRMQPEEVVSYLNTLFDFMIECINRHNGIVNKFLGDGFMAVFGAPVSDGRDSHNAVAAAREILKRVAAMNAFGDGEPTRVGMGLHAGPVLAGNVGSALRKEYTIIGDTVNLASRIESLNKQFGSCLLISEEVWHEAGDDVADAERLGPTAVKGKNELVPVYRLA